MVCSKQCQLLSVRLAQIADAQTQQPQRTRNQFFPAQQETSQPANISGLGDRFLDGNLACECGEIAAAHFHQDCVRPQTPMFEPRRNIRRLFLQAGTQHLPIKRKMAEK